MANFMERSTSGTICLQMRQSCLCIIRMLETELQKYTIVSQHEDNAPDIA
jgi:hypothetical protein